MEKRRAFRTERELFHADTCEPLKRAAAGGGLRLEAISRGGYPGTRLPGNELKELCMAGFWNAPGQQDWGLGWHCNEGIEIGYVSAGRLPFGIDQKSLTVGAGRADHHPAMAAAPGGRPERAGLSLFVDHSRRRDAPPQPAVAMV
jgi:AraC family L-rhamnose operon regulatory protein RhaS